MIQKDNLLSNFIAGYPTASKQVDISQISSKYFITGYFFAVKRSVFEMGNKIKVLDRLIKFNMYIKQK